MNAIEAIEVTRRFGDVVAVDRLAFNVASGEVMGLLGANGAGKTTTMKMLLGLLPPTSGQVRMLGVEVSDLDRRDVGYVPQGLGLYRDLTVRENVEFVAAAFGVPRPELEDAGLAEVADRRVSDLSLGQRRRTAFVVARCHDPSVLILDEPTSGVGPLGRARLWETIRRTAETGAAVLVSTHHMEEAQECDRVVLMAAGSGVATGSVEQIVAGARSTAIAGSLDDVELSQIRRLGGTALRVKDGWRVVGLDTQTVAGVVRGENQVSEVAASFEEVFVALSR